MKKLTPVQISGATVHMVSPEVVCFLMQDLDLVWVRYADRPWLKDHSLKVGDVLWVYWAQRGEPLAVAPCEATQKVEYLPQMEPVLI